MKPRILVLPARYRRARRGLASWITPRKGPGWRVSADRGFWVEPTIFTDVRNDMTIVREEIFGPVLAVIRSESTEQAIRIANDTEYGLSARVWSTDNQRALDVARQLEAGTVWVNDWHMVNAAYPFGGYKQSGLGRELGPHAFDEYTEAKFVHVDLSGRLDRRAYALLLGTPPA
jgi:aldehyde dehydrogenase (NAD+)